MSAIDILVPPRSARAWQLELAHRLRAGGHEVRVLSGSAADVWPATVRAVLSVEARLAGRGDVLWRSVDPAFDTPGGTADLVIDLGGDNPGDGSALVLTFDGLPSASAAAVALLAGRLPDLRVLRGGQVVARAAPMVDGRFQLGRGLDDILARAITLLVAAVEHPVAATPTMAPPQQRPSSQPGALASLAFSALPRTLREAARRQRHWPAHWRVGYRFHGGPGVAELGQLGGPEWTVLPDDGARYYADPFPFRHDGRDFIFVEEYPHATAKGVISVSEFDAAGRPSTPRLVLEEAHHLSYPQIISRNGEIFMLPEGGASRALTLYRAERFPDMWRPHAVLIEGRSLFDATLLEHGGKLWLLASEMDSAGSSSDTLVVFYAERLEGPWTAHPANPVVIDRRAARPGGAFTRVGRRIVRPVQDGTEGYGGGLGLSDLVRLDEHAVEFSRPVGIFGARSWPHPRIHTLNRCGRLEVIDGLAEVRKVRAA